MDDIFKKVSGFFASDEQKHSHTHEGEACHDLHVEHRENRYQSFAPQTSGHVKWHVDGCSYFWALSEALEGQAFQCSKLLITTSCTNESRCLYYRGPREYLHLGLVAVTGAVPAPPSCPKQQVPLGQHAPGCG